MDVTVIIVTYNSAPTIGECVASVRSQTGVELEILIVDNASTDHTVECIQKMGEGIALVANPENVGFGRANNQAFAASRGRYIYLLNPDAQLVQSCALSTLWESLEQHPNWGMAGTRVLSPDGREQSKPA